MKSVGIVSEMSMKRLIILCVAAGLLATGWTTGAGYEGLGATVGGDLFGVVKVTSLADKVDQALLKGL